MTWALPSAPGRVVVICAVLLAGCEPPGTNAPGGRPAEELDSATTTSSRAAETARVDVVLRGGTVVDGSGAAAFRADVAVADGVIVAVGEHIDAPTAGRVLNVDGLVVAPGFWDNHAHLVGLEEHPVAENFLRQGITTILAPLHSQDQAYPMAAYRERVRMAPNVGLFAGHTWIRKRVLGLEDRAPTAAELAEMELLVEEAMRDGALGLSTGLEYVPAVYADTEEIVALAAVAARHGGLYVTHMRDEGPGVLAAVDETLEVARRTGMPVQINHHKVTGAAQFGGSAQTLRRIDEARASGLRVAHDVYPYAAYSTYSDLMFPSWALAGGAEAFARRVADPAQRARLVREMRERFPQQTGEGPASIQFRTLDAHPELQGRTLADLLEERGRDTTVEEAVEALIELQLQGGFIGIFHGMDEGDIERILRHPAAMVETDGDLVQPGVGHPHPRSYGSFPRVLARYVRERSVLTLEEAVHKMTRMPALWVGHGERGLVAPGMTADLVVLDPETVTDRATYTDPHHFAEGVAHLLVGGVPVIQDGRLTGELPGEFLERRPLPDVGAWPPAPAGANRAIDP